MSTSRYGRAALEGEAQRAVGVLSGRHGTLLNSSLRIGSLVGTGEVEEDHAIAVLEQVGRALDLPAGEVRRTVRDGLAYGAKSPRAAPTDGTMIRNQKEARLELERWRQWIDHDPPKGRSSATQYRILLGLGLLAYACGKVRIAESHRDIALAAGVHHATVGRHMPKLTRWVRLTQGGSRFKGTRSVWQLLRPPDSIRLGDPVGPFLAQVSELAINLSQDAPGRRPNASAYAGLVQQETGHDPELLNPMHNFWAGRPAAFKIYRALSLDEMTVSQLADRAQVHRSSVYRSLELFASAGLVERLKASRTWRLISGKTVDHYDGLRDVTGDRHRRHQVEREAHKAWREKQIENNPSLTQEV